MIFIFMHVNILATHTYLHDHVITDGISMVHRCIYTYSYIFVYVYFVNCHAIVVLTTSE